MARVLESPSCPIRSCHTFRERPFPVGSRTLREMACLDSGHFPGGPYRGATRCGSCAFLLLAFLCPAGQGPRPLVRRHGIWWPGVLRRRIFAVRFRQRGLFWRLRPCQPRLSGRGQSCDGRQAGRLWRRRSSLRPTTGGPGSPEPGQSTRLAKGLVSGRLVGASLPLHRPNAHRRERDILADAFDGLFRNVVTLFLPSGNCGHENAPFSGVLEGKRMASGDTGNVVPRKGLWVRVPCPPFLHARSTGLAAAG